MQALTEENTWAAMDQFDMLVAESFQILVLGATDFELATGYIQRFAAKLRAGDALHLAIASNHGTKMVYTLTRACWRQPSC